MPNFISHAVSSKRLKKSARSVGAGFLALAFALCGACTQVVQVKNSTLASEHKRSDIYKTHVVVQSPILTDSSFHTTGGLFAIGFLNRWEVDIATNLPSAVASALSDTFEKVTVEDHYERGCGSCGLIIRPRIIDVGINKVTMQANVVLNLRIYDAHENLIASFNHDGKSPFLSFMRTGVISTSLQVPLVTGFMGKSVVRTSVRAALNKSLLDIKDRFHTETQDGGVLARVWRPKKLEYGEHEFTAERLAIKLGCDLTKDGINLVKQDYGKEEYDAYCWNVGVFSIECELGRCAIPEDQALAYERNKEPNIGTP